MFNHEGQFLQQVKFEINSSLELDESGIMVVETHIDEKDLYHCKSCQIN